MSRNSSLLTPHVGGLVGRVEGADEAGVACHLGFSHVDIHLGAVHEQVGLVAGITNEQIAHDDMAEHLDQ